MLRRGMKSDVRNVYSGSNGHAERLDRAIEVLVIQSILIMPDAGSWIADLVTHKPDAVITWVRLDPAYRRAGPRHDSRLLLHGGANSAKTEIRRATSHALLLIGDVVIHVALARVTLAPGVLVRDHVL